MISFNAVAEKKEHPSANKKYRSPNPLHKKEQDDAGKNRGDANAMQEFIPAGFLFGIVLRHVVRQAWHSGHLLAAKFACHSVGGGSTTVELRLNPEIVAGPSRHHRY